MEQGEIAVAYDPAALYLGLNDLVAEIEAALVHADASALVGADPVAALRRVLRQTTGADGEPLRIAVIGDFKRGKSTLINAVLGEEVTRADVVPETIVITEIAWGERPEAHLCLTDGRRVVLSPSALRRETLEPLIERFGATVDHLESRWPLEALHHATWIDTPGTNDLFRRFDAMVQKVLDRADLVLIVVSPASPVSQSELSFVQAAIPPGDFPKILAVVTMADQVRDPTDRERLVQRVRQKLGALLPQASVFWLSAEDEIARQHGTPRPRPDQQEALAAAFAIFRGELDDILQTHRDAIRFGRAGRRLHHALTSFLAPARAILAASAQDIQTLDQRVADLTRDAELRQASIGETLRAFQGEADRMGEEAAGWVCGHLRRAIAGLPEATQGLTARQIDQHLPFFINDVVEQAFAVSVRTHLPRLMTLLPDLPPEDVRALNGDTLAPGALATPAVGRGLESFVYMIADALLGVGILVSLIGQSRDAPETGSDAPSVVASYIGQCDVISAKVTDSVRAHYASISRKLSDAVVAHHRESIAQAVTALEQARQIRAAEPADAVLQRTALARLITRLEDLHAKAEADMPAPAPSPA